MTIVAGFVVGGGTPLDSIFVAADSRVNFSSPLSPEKVNSKTDKAQKIRFIGSSLIVGYAGDYYHANKMLDILSEANISETSPEETAAIITAKMQQQCTDSYSDVTFYVAIPFYIGTTLKWNLYTMSSPDFNAIKLNPGLHLIGMDAATRARFKACYEEVSRNTKPTSFAGLYIVPLLSAFEEVASEDVNGIITIAVMDADGYKFQNYAKSYDEGSNWIAVNSTNTGSFRFVNGKPFGGTTSDFKKLKTESNQRFDV